MTARLSIALVSLASVACKNDAPPAMDTSTTSDSSSGTSSGGTDTDASTGSTGESSSTTGPMPCVSDDECTDPDAPFCGTAGECGTCDTTADPDAACAGADPLLPLCVGDTCVACTPEVPLVCDDQLLLCDAGSNSCIPCTEHAQCGSGACELSVGTCFPDDFVVHVDGDPGAMPMPDYTSISAAVAAVADGMHGVIVVHELDGGGSYQTAGMGLRIDNGKTVALLAALGEAPRIQGTGTNPGVTVQGAGTFLYMDGLSLRSGDALGLHVDGAFAWVDQSRIVQNTGGGIVAENGAELTLRSSFVGDGTNGEHGLFVDGSSATVVSTTVGSGVDNFTDVFPIYCTGAVDVTIRNSVLVSFDNPSEISCSTAMVINTASEALIPGTGNTALGDIAVDWFVSIDAGDFHLDNPPAMLATTARWQTGDPLTDIDGDLRPTVDGTPDYAGADLVP